ncbi:MarP family serine protease [Haloechinothrix sp. LS1_15]|uniref:MarP family serine protease n=1 Tax=Haloechinothrix sp. LS1_15 TaxID=2652248 RepID=UPI002944D5F7|nr:MarP family serine protease [Haloechinothrix sp. LS1_15]MDV6011344.1 MarP family serine protease [Haloechinothrix sp. LS1_15]
MNWVDLLVVLLALLAAVSGGRQGVIVALPAFLGVLSGAVLGIRLAPSVVELVENPAAKVIFAVATVVFLVALGETFGVWIGRTVKERVSLPKLSWLDKSLGAVMQGAVVFVVAWLLAVPLTSVSGMPGLTAAINNSVVLGGVNDVMPPQAQRLPNDLRNLLDATIFPTFEQPFMRAPAPEVEPPDTALQASPVVQEVRPSVLKISGDAPACGRSLEGSGFVIAPQRVMTNAHVVAGTDSVRVNTDAGTLPARVVHFDPGIDVAVLDVPRLQAPVLDFAPRAGQAGDSTIVLGYPLDGPYTATSARIRDRINLQGPDIYDRATVQRDVFTVRAEVHSGNSGGPMVDPQGRVVGVVFGASVQDPDTGFTLTADQVSSEVSAAPGMTNEVSTGPCV